MTRDFGKTRVELRWLADVVAAMRASGKMTDEGTRYLAERIGWKVNGSPYEFSVLVAQEKVKYGEQE